VGTLEVTVANLYTAISLDEARQQCRLYGDTSHDPELLRLIAAVSAQFEQHTDIALLDQTMMLKLDGFTDYDIDLQVYPVSSITSIVYDNEVDAPITMPGADYYAQLGGMTPFVRAVNYYWPTTYANKPGSVRITLQAGYASPDAVPANIKQALLVQLYDMWNNPGDQITGVSVESSGAYKAIADKYRRRA
jgi:uncharacterized phiE125 gp8 family phage protein